VQKPKEVHTLYPVVHAPNLPTLLKRIKTKCNLTLEEIALEFQPESFIDTTKLGYRANANGYMLTYDGKDLGGACVKLPRYKPLRGRQVGANVKYFRECALRDIRDIANGCGDARYTKVIHDIVWGVAIR